MQASSDRQQRLEAALAHYLEAAQTGQPPDTELFVSEYPDLADDLHAFIAEHHRLAQLGRPLRALAEPPGLPAEYTLVRELGRGGMGVVFEARHVPLNRVVALKLILAGRFAAPDERARFQREAELAATLDHPHIVPLYHVGEHLGQPFLTMKYIAGRSLAEALRDGPFEPAAAARQVMTIAGAVHYAHQRGVIHRDLKPANVLLDEQGLPHVTDFGLAVRVEGKDGLTGTGQLVGTPSYMAPEQTTGRKDLSIAVDVHALGVLLYECLAGKVPWQAASTLETLHLVREAEAPPLPDHLPRDLDTITRKCLHKEPDRRYGSAAAVAEDLQRWLAGEPIHARPVGTMERVVKWVRRKPARAALVGVCLLAALVLGIGFAVSDGLVRQAYDDLQLEQEKTEAALVSEKAALGRSREAEQLARTRENDAHRAFASERRLGYARSIGLARSEWLANNLFRAEQILSECPEDLRGWEWGWLQRTCRAELLRIDGHERTPDLLAFSRDGKRLATGSEDGTFCVWDLVTGKLLHRFRKHTAPPLQLRGLAITPDGNHVVSAAGGEILRWDARTGAVSLRLEGSSVFALSPGGDRIAVRTETKSDDKELYGVKLFDTLTGRKLGSAELPVYPDTLAFSPDGSRLAVRGRGTAVFDVQPLQIRLELPEEYLEGYLPDGRLATWAKGKLTTRDADGKVIGQLSPGEGKLAFHPDGKRFARAAGGTVSVCELASGRELYRLRGFRGDVEALAFSPDGRTLVTSAGAPEREAWAPLIYTPRPVVQVWDVGVSQEARLVAQAASSLDLSADGRRLVLGGDQGVRVLDTGTGAVVAGNDSLKAGMVRVSPTGERVAAVDFLKIHIVDANGKSTASLKAPSVVMDLTFADDGRTLAVVGGDDVIAVYDAVAGKETRRMQGDGGGTMGLMFLPEGRLVRLTGTLVTAINGNVSTRGATLEVWDVGKGERVAYLDDMEDAGRGLTRSPDGKTLFVAVGRRVLEIDADSLETRRTIEGYGDVVQGLACGARTLAVAYPQGMKLWDLGSGHEVLTVAGSCTDVRFGGDRLVRRGEAGVEVFDGGPVAYREVRDRIKRPPSVKPVVAPDVPATKKDIPSLLEVVRDLERERDPEREKLHRLRTAGWLQDAVRWDAHWASEDVAGRWEHRVVDTRKRMGHLLWRYQDEDGSGSAIAVDSRCAIIRGRFNGTDSDISVRIHEVDTGKALGPAFRWDEDKLDSLKGAVSRDRKRTAIVGSAPYTNTAKVQLRDVASGRLLWSASVAPSRDQYGHSGIDGVRFSPCGRYLIVDGNKPARMLDVAGGRPVALDEEYKEVQFSDNGKHFVTVSGGRNNPNGGVQVWDAETRQRVGPRIEMPDVRSATFSPDGSRLLLNAGTLTVGQSFASVGWVLDLWDFAKGERCIPPVSSPGLGGRVIACGFTPDGKQLFAIHSGYRSTCRIQLWDTTGKPSGPPIELWDEAMDVPLFSADARYAFFRRRNPTGGHELQGWDLRLGEPITPRLSGRCLRVSEDGRQALFHESASKGISRHDLLPDERPAAELKRLAEAITGRTLDDKGKPRALTEEERRALRKHFDTWPSDAQGPRVWRDDSVLAWPDEPWQEFRSLHYRFGARKKGKLVIPEQVAAAVVGRADALLRKLGQGDRWALLEEVLTKDESEEMRDAAAFAVWKLGQGDPGKAAPILERALEKDTSDKVRARAAEALSDPVLAKVSVVGLLRCLKMEKTPQARVKAIAGLAQAGGTRPEVVAALIEAVNKDEAVSVRFTAVSALRHAAGHEAQTVPVLLKACQDTNAGMRSAALQTLGFIKGYDREVAAALVAALNDAHEQVRTTAETGLDHPQRAAFAVEPLARLVSAKPHQHLTAIHALTYALPGSALAKKTLLDVVTIDRKTYRSSGNSTRDKTILLLLQTIPDDEQVRAVFAEYLNLSETERNKSSLQQNVAARLNALNHVVKMGDRARPYVPRLVAFLQQEPPIHDDTTVPWFVVQSLGKLGPHAEEAIPALIDLLARDAVGYTFWAMPSSGHPELAYPAGIALARIGGKAIPALLRTLGEDREPRKRIGAANALGYCRADKDLVIPRLEAALKKLDEVKPETPRLKAQIEAALAMLRGATFQMPKPHEPKLN